MLALLDADILTYEIGFMAQKKQPDGSLALLHEDVVLKVLEDKIYNIVEKSGADDFRLYLSGASPNFRYAVATLKPYKGNRSGIDKPHYFSLIKDYMLQEFNPVVADYIEADDQLRIDQIANNNECVICGIDKDLNQIVGLHYNWRKDYVYEITEDASNCWFWSQSLIGDTADNIPGINRWGPKRSVDLLVNKTPEERKDACISLYKKQYGDVWESSLQEVGALLHLLRHPDDYFDYETY